MATVRGGVCKVQRPFVVMIAVALFERLGAQPEVVCDAVTVRGGQEHVARALAAVDAAELTRETETDLSDLDRLAHLIDLPTSRRPYWPRMSKVVVPGLRTLL